MPFPFQVFQFRHDVRPVPGRKLRISNLLDYVPEVQETEDRVISGAVKEAYVPSAAPQRNGAFNLVKCDFTREELASELLICHCKSTLHAGSCREEGFDPDKVLSAL